MASGNKKRDYRITEPENKLAYEKGFAGAEWYASPIPRQRLKELMKRKDGPAIRDTIIWIALLIGSGFLAYYSWGTWWAVPAFGFYGTIYATTGDSRWHECGHGTAFKTPWLNDVIYQIASFMVIRPATPWRWSHTRHHSDTYIVGRDPEIAMSRPPVWRILMMEIFHLYGGPKTFKRILLHCIGKLDKEEREYLPETEYSKTFWESRIWVLIILGVVIWCISIKSILPAMFIVLPAFYGVLVMLMHGVVQHLGLHEDVLDHRLNTRTVYMNFFSRFLYWNMNYHIEHHMFPMVPYHALPALHEELKPDFPKPTPTLSLALIEVIRALLRQKKDPRYVIDRPLPATANPYRYGPQQDIKYAAAE